MKFNDLGKVIDIHDFEKSNRNITRIVVHCTATPLGRYHTVFDIDEWHKKRGFDGIGYHYLVGVSGEVTQGRSIHSKGAHAKGYNKNSLAIVLAGGTNDKLIATEKAFTADQFLFLESFLKELQIMYPNAEIVGHRELPGVNKACPCFEVKDLLCQ